MILLGCLYLSVISKKSEVKCFFYLSHLLSVYFCTFIDVLGSLLSLKITSFTMFFEMTKLNQSFQIYKVIILIIHNCKDFIFIEFSWKNSFNSVALFGVSA